MPAQVVEWLFSAAVGILLCLAVVVTQVFGRLWLQACLSGARVQALDILGMRLRGSDAGAIVRAMIQAAQAGLTISCKEMEAAHLQGVDLRKVILAAMQAKREGLPMTFQELVDAELADQLESRLQPASGKMG